MGGQVKSKKDKKDSNGKMSLKYFDRSVYDRGFRYYDFIDDPNHSMRSEIQLFDFQDSPERILLHLSEKAQIIGISATATLETVVGNYDLEYLQRMLQDKFYVMPEVDKCRLQESFRTFVANYDKVNIHVEPVCYSTDDTAELAEIFNGNEALIKKYAEKLSILFERVEYAKNNFIRVVKVMKAFILNDSVKSFLCLNNKLPQENKGLFDIKLLEEFADDIIKLYGIKGLKGKDLLYSINSEDYDAKRAEFIQRLSKGEKLFVISSYNTVGAGQNLQYKAPGNATIVAVNDYDRGDMEKDFDCIYLEKPTNLLVNVDSKKGIEAEDLIRFVYQMEFLMERGEVSRKDGIAVSGKGMEDMISNMMLQAQVTEEQLKERQEIKTETGVVLSWKYLCWVREHPVKSICKETNILYGTQDEMIPYKIVKKFSEENNCRLNFVENGQHWLHTDREVAAMRKWEQTVLEESRSIIPNK